LVHACFAHAALTNLLVNMPEWNLAAGGGVTAAKQLMLRQLSAAEGTSAQSEVQNNLGVACQMLVNIGDTQVEVVMVMMHKLILATAK
jgi:hypothetical protein